MIEMKDGFYKYIANNLIYAANSIHAPNYDLRREDKDTYQLPIDSWYWFDTLQNACDFYQLNINDYLPKTSNNTSITTSGT